MSRPVKLTKWTDENIRRLSLGAGESQAAHFYPTDTPKLTLKVLVGKKKKSLSHTLCVDGKRTWVPIATGTWTDPELGTATLDAEKAMKWAVENFKSKAAPTVDDESLLGVCNRYYRLRIENKRLRAFEWKRVLIGISHRRNGRL